MQDTPKEVKEFFSKASKDWHKKNPRPKDYYVKLQKLSVKARKKKKKKGLSTDKKKALV